MFSFLKSESCFESDSVLINSMNCLQEYGKKICKESLSFISFKANFLKNIFVLLSSVNEIKNDIVSPIEVI